MEAEADNLRDQMQANQNASKVLKKIAISCNGESSLLSPLETCECPCGPCGNAQGSELGPGRQKEARGPRIPGRRGHAAAKDEARRAANGQIGNN